MNVQKRKISKKSILIAGSVLVLVGILFVRFSTGLREWLNLRENDASVLLLRSKTWRELHATKRNKWDPSDGTSSEYVIDEPTNSGIEIVIAASPENAREAYYNAKIMAARSFVLTSEIIIPKSFDCRNGLVFSGNAEGEYYLFLVGYSTYTVEILRREANEDLPREAIIENTAIPESIGEPGVLTVLGDGDHYSFYINDILVNEMRDSRLSGNRVGVEAFT